MSRNKIILVIVIFLSGMLLIPHLSMEIASTGETGEVQDLESYSDYKKFTQVEAIYANEYKGYARQVPIYSARAEMKKLAWKQGEKIRVEIDLYLNIDNLKERMDEVEALYAALSAERIFDVEGNPHSFDNLGMSTLLTTTGMPIENLTEGISHSKVGKNYKSLFELYNEKEPDTELEAGDLKHVRFELEGVIPNDLPSGFYRFEIDLGYITKNNSAIRWELYKLHGKTLKARKFPMRRNFFNILNVIFALRQHHFSPVFRVGEPSRPHMIWTLLANEYGYKARGIVSDEDKDKFALNLNQTGPALPIYPMRNQDGSYRAYNLEPDFPMENQTDLFFQEQQFANGKFYPTYVNLFPYSSDSIPLDYKSGRLKVTVHTPSGATRELGDMPFAVKTKTGASTNSGKFRYVFREYGRYTIECKGWINDIWGNRYEGGGTYKIWIAEPLSFSTSTKPGMPFPVGASFSTRVTVHPQVPADIEFKVWHYRNSDPDDVKYMEYKGKANSFGYHFAIPEKKMTFDAPGEYRSEIVARYVDNAGRLWMGAAINGALVYGADYKLKVHGDPGPLILLNRDSPRYRMGREFINSSLLTSIGNPCLNITRRFPHNMEDVSMLAAPNAGRDSIIVPKLTFEDPTGYWKKKILDDFPPFNDYLANSCPEGMDIINKKIGWFDFFPMAVPDCVIAEASNIMVMHKRRENLPLLILSENSIQPYSYPEKIKAKCYFYSSSIRPGLTARRTVSDSTHSHGYWQPFPNSFNGRLGFVSNGDMPTEHYRLIGGVVCKDLETGRYDNAPYHGALVLTDKGFNDDRVVAPFQEPFLEVAGRKMYAIIASSPEPGSIYLTGDLVSNGGFVFPVTEMDFIWNIKLPDGKLIAQKGRTNELGLAFPPKRVFTADLPGVYRITQKLGKNGELGGVVGTGDDSFNIYVVEKDSPYKISLEGPPVTLIEDIEKGVILRGRIPSGVKDPKLYHTVIMPGCVLAEGTLPVDEEGRFSFEFRPLDHSVHCSTYDVVLGETRVAKLSDIVSFSFFLQAKDANGKLVTAGRHAAIIHDRLHIGDLTSFEPSALSHHYNSEERPNLAKMAHPGMARYFYPEGEEKHNIDSLVKNFDKFKESFQPKPPRLFSKKGNMLKNCASCHSYRDFLPMELDPKNLRGVVEYHRKKQPVNLIRLCYSCHSHEKVLSLGLDRGQWRRVLNFHWKKHPLFFTTDEFEDALETLQTEFGTFWPVNEERKRKLMTGKEIYQAKCLACHDKKRVLYGSKYSSGWKNLIASMSAMMEEPLPEKDKVILHEYLSWRQAREYDLSDIPALENGKAWKKQRSLYQKVCFACHALPFLKDHPWPKDSTEFMLFHIREKGPNLATLEQIKDLAKYLDYKKKFMQYNTRGRGFF